jgi:RNA-binding protein
MQDGKATHTPCPHHIDCGLVLILLFIKDRRRLPPAGKRFFCSQIIQKGESVEKLKGFQKKYLRGLAHGKKPLVLIGQKGMSPSLIQAIDEALDTHELIKVKFNEFKEKDEKAAVVEIVETQTGAEMVGMICHMAIFFRQQKDPEKRKIIIPKR